MNFMWSGENKVWMHYLNDILAADIYSAVFLSTYLKHAVITRDYTNYLEVIDLQKYKIYHGNPGVRIAIAKSMDTPFIFIAGKN